MEFTIWRLMEGFAPDAMPDEDEVWEMEKLYEQMYLHTPEDFVEAADSDAEPF